ncbi:hypothetical protein BCR33DRAFT_774961 [Rhizoclosmatium globosum]|uniref:F-box domain-containing protein n=1 Tax=Rhizoclosmatium globosum TaxID=329046 RepID=A0A1Y2ANK4_9FUNG|nr:hypothetical protein BCR33DRAFT_774961 [Rhizoclosmatium globosum]|eukprot:ORY24139.1 hypothetical protein BCR33DRAFT_774961 [Rhizoclosmatium globosum]
MDSLPVELATRILCHIDLPEVFKLRRLSKSFNNLLVTEYFITQWFSFSIKEQHPGPVPPINLLLWRTRALQAHSRRIVKVVDSPGLRKAADSHRRSCDPRIAVTFHTARRTPPCRKRIRRISSAQLSSGIPQNPVARFK